MKIKQKAVGVAVAGAFVLASSAASAAITTFNDVASFDAAVQSSAFYTTPYEIEHFVQGGLEHANLSITGNAVQLGVAPDPYFSVANNGWVMEAIVNNSTASTVTISFGGRSMYALGAAWNTAYPGGPGSNITLNLVDGATTTLTAANWVPNSYNQVFQGFVSDVAFTSVVLTEGTGAGSQETFQLDNLKYAQAVPEPETYAMLIAGLGLMGFVARRRKKSAML